MTHTKDTPKCPNCGDGTIPSGDTWKLTPEAERYYKDHPEDKPRVNFSGCPVCGREEIQEMERAINEGFAESERDLKNKKTPLDTPKETWHDKLIRLPCVMTFSQIDGEQLEAFIAHELELARREFVEEAIERIMKCRKDIIKYQNATDILSKAVTKHEKAWINSGFRLALESTNELLAYYLATLREEKEGSE